MAHQRWYEQGRDDERGSTRDDREGRRDRFGDGDETRGTVGRRQFSDDANQGGYAQGQYARERGRHEQSGYGHGGRDGQGGPGPRGGGHGGRREQWMGSDDERLRADRESSRYGSGGGWSRSPDERSRWSARDDEHRGEVGRFEPRARDLVGGGRPEQRGVSWTAERGPQGEPRWSRERGGWGGERSFGAREEPRYRVEPGGRPGGSPWHPDDDRSPAGYGRAGRSGGDYGRFDNDDQDIRVHGGRFKSRDDDDHRYGMGLQGGAGRGRWVTDPRVDDDERYEGRERSWGRQVWAEDERYHTRGGPEARRLDDENRFRRSDEAEPWRSHGRSDLDRDRDEERGGGSPIPWRSVNLGARGWSDRDRDLS